MTFEIHLPTLLHCAAFCKPACNCDGLWHRRARRSVVDVGSRCTTGTVPYPQARPLHRAFVVLAQQPTDSFICDWVQKPGGVKQQSSTADREAKKRPGPKTSRQDAVLFNAGAGLYGHNDNRCLGRYGRVRKGWCRLHSQQHQIKLLHSSSSGHSMDTVSNPAMHAPQENLCQTTT